MRDANEQPCNDDQRQAAVPSVERGPNSVGGGEPIALLADYDQAMASTAVGILCGVLARHPTATVTDLRELLKAHPSIGKITLAELSSSTLEKVELECTMRRPAAQSAHSALLPVAT